ncbi:glycosyltransferase [Bacteroidales bacterium OttesenSCG-928-I21]|nr:glycosyltransferase [Bacteroidales bacterium OttesenSCG-928-I21]
MNKRENNPNTKAPSPQRKDSGGFFVVIPCYDDEFIFNTLQSLEETRETESEVEVIVVVNSSENTPFHIVEKNRKIFDELEKKANSFYYKRFKLLPVNIENTVKKKGGVGHARKTGMDEAVRRFSAVSKPNGIIISLDADTLVGKNYFVEIENAFKKNPKINAFTFQFRHDFNEKIYSEEEIEACRLYETYLRYYRLSLKTTGFPYCFHTIGSCFAVTASAYTKVGGMPQKQGGEDFYFLHKLAQTTEIGEIKATIVYPSPRISDRVPFGTGPSVRNIISDKKYLVYNFELFFILKKFFDCFPDFWKSDAINIKNIPNEIVDFWGEKKVIETIKECKENSAQEKYFIKRLYSKFDAFFVVKFLNSFDEKSNFPPIDVKNAASMLLQYYDKKEAENIYDTVLELDFLLH